MPHHGKPKVIFRNLEELILELVSHPDEAYIRSDNKQALVFSTEHDAVLNLEGDFSGLPDEVAWELRRALREQHPLPEPDPEEVIYDDVESGLAD